MNRKQMKHIFLILVLIVFGCASPRVENVKVWDDPITPADPEYGLVGLGGDISPEDTPWRLQTRDVEVGIDANTQATVAQIIEAVAKHTHLDIRCESALLKRVTPDGGLILRRISVEYLIQHLALDLGASVTNRGEVIIITGDPNNRIHGIGEELAEP